MSVVSSSKFNGSYHDPNCPYGWRTIIANSANTCIVAGKDSNVGAVWWAEGTTKEEPDGTSTTITVDFSGKCKGTSGVLAAKHVDEGIEFPDGVIWKRFESKDSSAKIFEGTFIDPGYPTGWRTIAADGSDTAMVVGLDTSVGTAWYSPGTIVTDDKGTKLNIDFSKRMHGYQIVGATKVEEGLSFPGKEEIIWKPKQLEPDTETSKGCGCEGEGNCVLS
mmetsp:Transcript_6996/g.12080  ORF Transcript_6996/g.12080 Transcript_6996/m.12080 type:complete len:220 (-) Transcript_6996:294-953(-)